MKDKIGSSQPEKHNGEAIPPPLPDNVIQLRPPRPEQLEFKFTFGSPLLVEMGAQLWSPEKMEKMADLCAQSEHQLRVVAKILRHRAHRRARRQRALRYLLHQA